MGSKLYVGNIPFNATEEDLRRVFSEGGRRVVEVQIMADRNTGRSRGFAFVTMSSDQEAFDAASALNGANMGGRPMRVNEAQDRPGFSRGGPGGEGGGGGRGGFRGGRGGGGGRRDDRDSGGDYR